MTALFEHIQTLAAQPGRRFASILEAGAWRDQTYADLWRRALSFAGLFRASGLAPDDVVCLIVKPGADAYAAFLGGMAAGGLPSFLPYPNSKHDTGLYWAQHKTLFGHARPRLILTWDELAPEVEPCADGSGARVLELRVWLLAVSRPPDDLAASNRPCAFENDKKCDRQADPVKWLHGVLLAKQWINQWIGELRQAAA